MLIQKLKNPHKRKTEINPQIKEMRCLCWIIIETRKATIATVHQGKYKQARKLKIMMSKADAKNFIVDLVYSLQREIR